MRLPGHPEGPKVFGDVAVRHMVADSKYRIGDPSDFYVGRTLMSALALGGAPSTRRCCSAPVAG